MPIISVIGRKSLKTRALVAVIYALLIGGGVTMVYPFLLMIAGSTKSTIDSPEAEVVPGFLANDTGLWRKFSETWFNESSMVMRSSWNTPGESFRTVEVPQNIDATLIEDWQAFLSENEQPQYAWTLGAAGVSSSKNVMPENLRRFRNQMIEEYDNDLSAMNKAMQTEFATWSIFKPPVQVFSQRRIMQIQGPFAEAFGKFALTRPLWERHYFCADRFYVYDFLQSQYTDNLDVYNREHNTAYASWDEIVLSRTAPENKQQRQDWNVFVRTVLNLYWIRLQPQVAQRYHDYLRAKYTDIANLNKRYQTTYADFDNVVFSEVWPATGTIGSDWQAFLQGWKDPGDGKLHIAAVDHITLDTTEFRFQDYLAKKYGSLDGFNQAHLAKAANWAMVLPPQQAYQYSEFLKHRSELAWEFILRNFYTVIDTVFLHGRAVLNTVIFCFLTIVCALTFNPLAAYALSRYKPPSAYKVLLFLMMTMAFPPMVTQIPVFLMLREFHLLNTFAALILPALANGYSIFLLKGFFDSLPGELYEAAEIDGASEFRIFWQLTMSLSKPILAVIALHAFTAAYSNFMMALLICQDNTMWTLMPWLYQLQMTSSQGIIYASLIVAAVPTFLVFALCQNVIMRGIVVPVEK